MLRRSAQQLAMGLAKLRSAHPPGAARATSSWTSTAPSNPATNSAAGAIQRAAERCPAPGGGAALPGVSARSHRRPPATGRRGLMQGVATAQQQAVQATEGPLTLRERVEKVPTGPRVKEAISVKAQIIFDTSWKRMEARLENSYVCPREIVWLNGAPGSGKGTNMPFIMASRGLSRAIGMSQLLDGSPEIRSMIDRGELVPDAAVLDALLDAVLNPDLNDGAGLVIDGFPRTATQVEFVKALHDRLLDLHLRAADGPDEWRFPRPSFKVVILYVDEEESVRRQERRAQLASLHNKRVMDAGTGDVWAVRTTDVSEALCRRRYQVFKAHYNTILRLKSYFPFSLIDAMGTLEECRAQIVRELRYQSSLDLDERTYAAIRHLPLARDLVRVARQRLVFRLDSYCKRHYRTFLDVVRLIDTEVLPLLKQSSLAGHAEFRTRAPLLLGNALAVDMLIDVLTDRGFSVGHACEERVVPERIDLATGEVACRTENVHAFRITFDKENVRDLSTPASVTTRQGEDVAIGTTWVPEHLRRENAKRREEATVVVPGGERGARPRAPADGYGAPAAAAAAATAAAGATARRQEEGVVQAAAAAAARDAVGGADAHEVSEAQLDQEMLFFSGWDSMDVELNAATRDRNYGWIQEKMNDRED